jgi:ABC-type phosphate transport system auxiliary subunit
MAKVIHKRGDRRYIYEHKRINGKVVSKYIAHLDDETSALRERIAELEDVLQCKTTREARKKAGVVQEVAQHGT